MYCYYPSYNFRCVLSLTASIYQKKKKKKKRQVSRVNGTSDDDYGSNLNLNKTKVTNASSRRRKAEGSHRISSRKEREQRELWGWQ